MLDAARRMCPSHLAHPLVLTLFPFRGGGSGALSPAARETAEAMRARAPALSGQPIPGGRFGGGLTAPFECPCARDPRGEGR